MKKVLVSVTFIFLSMVLYAETIDYVNVSDMEVLLDLPDTSLADIAIAADSDKNIYLAQSTDGELNILKSVDSGGDFDPLDLSLYDLPTQIADLKAVNIFYNDWCFLFTGERNGLGGLFLLVPGEKIQLIEVYSAGDCEISSIEVYNDFFNPFYILFKDNGFFYCCYIDPVDDFNCTTTILGDYTSCDFIKKTIKNDFYCLTFLLQKELEGEKGLFELFQGEIQIIPFESISENFSQVIASESALYCFSSITLYIYSISELGIVLSRNIPVGKASYPSVFEVEGADYLTFVTNEDKVISLYLYTESFNPLSPLKLISMGLKNENYAFCPTESGAITLSFITETGLETTTFNPDNNEIATKIQTMSIPDQIFVSRDYFDFYIIMIYRDIPLELRMEIFGWNGLEYEFIKEVFQKIPEESGYLFTGQYSEESILSNTTLIRNKAGLYLEGNLNKIRFFEIGEASLFLLLENETGVLFLEGGLQ